MSYEYFYEGTPYGMEPGSDSVYTGAALPARSIGFPTSVQTANQVQEVSKGLSTGAKVIEASALQPEVFDMMPKQHLQEINRQAKLVGADITIHGPVIEPSGFTQQGWSEQNRELAERQLADTLLRCHEISPDKPTPVTLHSSMIPGTETMPADAIPDITDEEKRIYGDKIPVNLVVVEQETGRPHFLPREEMITPGKGKEIWTPQRRLDSLNETQWHQRLSQIALYKKEGDDILERAHALASQAGLGTDYYTGKNLSEEQKQALLNRAEQQRKKADLFYSDVGASFRSIYEQAAKYGGAESKKVLQEISDDWKSSKGTTTELLDKSLVKIQDIDAPKLFTPIEDFATKQASETFANIAWKAYDKFGEKAPIISIENPPYGTAISTAEDLKELIKESRKKFEQKAISEGMSESEAKRAAESMIGATWDTSHISMMRRMGFKKKELVEQAEIIAPFVKHVHMNDNFGYTHTDLPPGMGDVPFKKIMEKFKKEGYKGKHIFEGGQFFQQFKVAPHAMVLEAMGSPIYGVVAKPTWTQGYGITGAYSMGYGPFLPSQHFSIYGGGGFSGMPVELGGQAMGSQSRLSGTPNQ